MTKWPRAGPRTQESAHLTKQSRQGYNSPDVDTHEAISPCDNKGQVMIHRFVICICEKDAKECDSVGSDVSGTLLK